MNLRGIFEVSNKEKEILLLEEEVSKEDFWQDIDKANSINKKLANLKKDVLLYKKLEKSINDNIELLENSDDEMMMLISDELRAIKNKLNELETSVTLSGEFDNLNCYLEIHPGAGGTEACDWTEMLARMYQKYAEKIGFKWEIIDEQKGDEAGLKSITLKISGDYAYGYLKSENGVHRLVRISPFDAGGRRHTSFASVSIMPEITKDINIDIFI